jgi:Holliday junction resolvase RusA-like endonuclease
MNAARLHDSERLQRVAGLLQDGEPYSTREIMMGARVCAVNSCIAELRQNGFKISCKRVAGVFYYRVLRWDSGYPANPPRFARSSGRAYDPAKSRSWKQFVALRANLERLEPFAAGVPLAVSMTFNFIKPKGAKREHHTVRGDLTNLAKGIEDALNGIAYHDDSQIVQLSLVKVYSDKEGVDVWIEEL